MVHMSELFNKINILYYRENREQIFKNTIFNSFISGHYTFLLNHNTKATHFVGAIQINKQTHTLS